MTRLHRYDPATALIVVDIQNDFADADGGLYVSGGHDVIPVVNAEIAEARASGAFVCYTQDWHPEYTPHFARDGGIWPVHCVAGTWGAEFHPDLVVDGPTVRKGSNGEDGYSGFTMRDPLTGETMPTELTALLRERSIEHLVVVGLALDYCVKDTTLDGLAEGFAATVLLDATRAVELTPGDAAAARSSLQAAGADLQ